MKLVITKTTKDAEVAVKGTNLKLTANNIITGKAEDNTPAIIYTAGLKVQYDDTKYIAIFVPDRNIGGKSLMLAEGVQRIKSDEEVYVAYKLNCGNAIPALYNKGDVLGEVIFLPIEVAEIGEIVEYVEPVKEEMSMTPSPEMNADTNISEPAQ